MPAVLVNIVDQTAYYYFCSASANIILFSIGTVSCSYVHQMKQDGVSGITCDSARQLRHQLSGDGFGPSKFTFEPSCLNSPIVITA